jgi:hypothetical protein
MLLAAIMVAGARGKTTTSVNPHLDLTYQKSYLARLNYVHQNPVKHALVAVADQYAWCSAQWFEQTASPAMVRSIYAFKTESVSVNDDFVPMLEP